jgi:hypothetical protein
MTHVIRDRSEDTCRALWNQIAATYRGCRSFNDLWEACHLVFLQKTHECVGKGRRKPIVWSVCTTN